MTIDPLPETRRLIAGTNSPVNFMSLYRLLALLVGIATLGSLSGCAESDLPPGLTKKAIAIDEVPAEARAAAKKAIPSVDFKEAWQNLDGQGKLHSYEIRGRQASNGKIREVRVSLSGEILESE
jgi:hypothetical protein